MVQSSKIGTVFEFSNFNICTKTNLNREFINFDVLRTLSVMLIFVLLLPPVSAQAGEFSHNPSVRIIFDNQNSSLRIYLNSSEYFNLTFRKIYIATNPYEMGDDFDVDNFFMGSAEIGSMNMSSKEGWSREMGNYTRVVMWKSLNVKNRNDIPFMEPKNVKVNITVEFFMAEKSYTKDGIVIGRNTIRFSTKISTDSRGNFIFLEESMGALNLTTGAPGEVFEMGWNHGVHWNRMNMTDGFVKHQFGGNNLGALKFRISRSNITYSWGSRYVRSTLYSYNGESFHLLYGFQNENGTILQDPYITLPVPIMGNPNTVVEGVENAVNYLIDHAISFGMGIAAAVIIVLTGPLARRLH